MPHALPRIDRPAPQAFFRELASRRRPVPATWWHYLRAVEPSISLNFWWHTPGTLWGPPGHLVHEGRARLRRWLRRRRGR